MVQSTLPASDGRRGVFPEDPLAPPRKESAEDEDDEDDDVDADYAVAAADGEVRAPLIIPADATLVDGLRALLVHHLKRSVGTAVVSLSSSQAELLEHHLARLASYATKIVHTLAFATRFLSKQQQGDGAEQGQGADPSGVASQGRAVGLPPGATGAPGAQPYAGGAAYSSPYGGRASQPSEPRPQRKALKLNDDEILSLFRNAQMEAAMEADWRGISGPIMSRDSASSGGAQDGWTGAASGSGTPAKEPHVSKDPASQEYLRMLSRALQQPGRSPRAFTAQILDPQKETACCQPNVENSSMTLAAAGKTGLLRLPDAGPPDPGNLRPGRSQP